MACLLALQPADHHAAHRKYPGRRLCTAFYVHVSCAADRSHPIDRLPHNPI